jgi:hypothetical protein
VTTSLKPPLKGHWPVAFALGGTPDDPALVPLNYTFNVLAGDECRVPASLPEDAGLAAIIEATLDEHKRVRISPAVGRDGVIAVLSIPDFAALPVIVSDDAATGLAELSPTPRACITVERVRAAAREVVPDRDPAEGAPLPAGAPLTVARDTAYCVYWAIGDVITDTRRSKAMAAAGWPPLPDA